MALRFSQKTSLDTLARLAVQLGVSVGALAHLGVGYADEMRFGPPCWTFPERNEEGWVVGMVRRLVAPTDGRGKLFCKGARRGLSYCDRWDDRPGPVWLVEGGTDVAAGLTLDLCVVGRPNNTGGVEMLARLLKTQGQRKVFVVGERDRKDVVTGPPEHDPRCRGCMRCYPGLAGAKQVAQALARRLGRAIDVTLPPIGYKDMRDWVRSLDETERVGYAKALMHGRWTAPGRARAA